MSVQLRTRSTSTGGSTHEVLSKCEIFVKRRKIYIVARCEQKSNRITLPIRDRSSQVTNLRKVETRSPGTARSGSALLIFREVSVVSQMIIIFEGQFIFW